MVPAEASIIYIYIYILYYYMYKKLIKKKKSNVVHFKKIAR